MVTLAESTNVTTGAQRRIAPSKSGGFGSDKDQPAAWKSAVSLSGLNVLVLIFKVARRTNSKTFAEIFRKSGVSPRRAASSPAKIYPPSLENRKVRSSPLVDRFRHKSQSSELRPPGHLNSFPNYCLPGLDSRSKQMAVGQLRNRL